MRKSIIALVMAVLCFGLCLSSCHTQEGDQHRTDGRTSASSVTDTATTDRESVTETAPLPSGTDGETTELPSDTSDTISSEQEPLIMADMMLTLLRRAGCPEELMVTIAGSIDSEIAESFHTYFEDESTWSFLSVEGDPEHNPPFFRPEDINLAGVIYASTDQAYRLDWSNTEEEQALRQAKGLTEEDMLWDTRRFTTAELSAWVEAYLGVPLTQEMIDRMMATTFWGSQSPMVYYLEEYDAYYLSASDTNVFSYPTVGAGFVTEDGRYLLFLYSGIYEDSYRIALYKPAESGYYLNMMVCINGLY